MTWSYCDHHTSFFLFVMCCRVLPPFLCPAWSPAGYCRSSGAGSHFVFFHSVFAPATRGIWSLQGPQLRSHLALIKKRKSRIWCFYFKTKFNIICVNCFFKVTCSVWGGYDIGGKHLDTCFLMSLLRQALQHPLPHATLHFQQLLTTQTQSVEDGLTLRLLSSISVCHCCYHGSTFPTTTLGRQKTDITVWHELPDHLVQPPRKPKKSKSNY